MCNSSCAFAARCADGSILSVSMARVQKYAREKNHQKSGVGLFLNKGSVNFSQVSAVFYFQVRIHFTIMTSFIYIPRVKLNGTACIFEVLFCAGVLQNGVATVVPSKILERCRLDNLGNVRDVDVGSTKHPIKKMYPP